jgi:hypothetical protein
MPAPLGWAQARQGGDSLGAPPEGAGADISHEVVLGDGPGARGPRAACRGQARPCSRVDNVRLQALGGQDGCHRRVSRQIAGCPGLAVDISRMLAHGSSVGAGGGIGHENEDPRGLMRGPR